MKINRENLLNDLNLVKAGLSPREFIEQSSCMTSDTVLHTLEGDFTIRNLLQKGKTSFLVYSNDGTSLQIGKAHSLRKTKSDAKVYQVLFDTGHSIKLTADHLVMMRDGSYKAVEDLEVGDSAMPFNRRMDSTGYLVIYSKIDRARKRAHVWVYEKVTGKVAVNKGYNVHHKDENQLNNLPSNLEELTKQEHARLHCLKCAPMHRRVGSAEKLSKSMMGNKNGCGGKGKPSPLKGLPLSEAHKQALRQPHKKNRQGGTTEGMLKAWETRRFNGLRASVNHKVISVQYAGREDVYDLTVDKYNNFAANGIFIHNCLCFQDGWVFTFNDEVACRKKVELNITGAIQATSLFAILEKLDDPELQVRENDKNELEFRGNGKGFGVTKDVEIFLPIDRVEIPSKWRSLPKEFTEAVGLVQHCVSTDESKFLLTCIHISPEFVEATDNLQIMRVEVETGLEEDVLVRGTSLAHIVNLAMDKVAMTKSWIHFKNQQGLIFSCRRYAEKYPALEKFITFKGNAIVIPKGLVEASDRASVFATDKAGEPLIKVSIRDGVIRILGEGLTGWYKEVKKVSYDGPPLEFMIAPELLKHISEKYSDAQLTADKLKVVGGHWQYVTCLGKPEEEKEETEASEEE